MPICLENFSVQKAHTAQTCLSKNVIREDKLPSKITSVGGIDVSYLGDFGIGAVTGLDYETRKVLEAKVATCKVKIPYLPNTTRIQRTSTYTISHKTFENST